MCILYWYTVCSISSPVLTCALLYRSPSSVAPGHKLTAPLCCLDCLSLLSALQNVKQTNISSSTLHCNNLCIYTVYCTVVLYEYSVHQTVSWVIASHSKDFYKKNGANTLTRRESSPLHGAADRSSTSITYIFIFALFWAREVSSFTTLTGCGQRLTAYLTY